MRRPSKKDEPEEAAPTEPTVAPPKKLPDEGWKDENVMIYSETPSMIRVCAKASLTPEQVVEMTNAKTPSWRRSKAKFDWKVSSNEPCKRFPGERTHYVLN